MLLRTLKARKGCDVLNRCSVAVDLAPEVLCSAAESSAQSDKGPQQTVL